MSTTIEILDSSGVAVEVAIATPGEKGDPSAGYYASIIDTTDQALASTTAGQAVALGTSLEADGITLAGNAVTFSTTGVYSVTWSIQFANADNNTIRTADVWHVVNGAAIPDSNSRFDVPGAHGGKNGHLIATVNMVRTFNVGDDLQLFWVADSVTVSIETLAAEISPMRPGTPGVFLTVTQVR
ncbi:MAG: hypothetical protein RL758_45 [Pseudomonadota bacterium]|jgi:hypothetical protein